MQQQETWQQWLMKCRVASTRHSRRIGVKQLVDMNRQPIAWYSDLRTGDLVNAEGAFMDCTAMEYYTHEDAPMPTHATPIFGYEKQEAGFVFLFVDPSLTYAIVQAKFGGGNPGAQLTDTARETKKGILVAPTFEASASNLFHSGGAISYNSIVRYALHQGRIKGPEVIQDEGRFDRKRNVVGVLVLTEAEWGTLCTHLNSSQRIVSYEELSEILYDGDGSGVGYEYRMRSEGNEHLLQVFGILTISRIRMCGG